MLEVVSPEDRRIRHQFLHAAESERLRQQSLHPWRYQSTSPEEIARWLKSLDAIPRDVLPDGPARDQLVAEATVGDLTDAYKTNDGLPRNQGWLIERPTPGRSETRWAPRDWMIYVDAGMPALIDS